MKDSFNTYNLNSVIERLHRTKKDYQRNMLIPLLGLIIVSVIIIIIQSLDFSNTTNQNSFRGKLYNNSISNPEESGLKSPPHSSGISSTISIDGKLILFKNYRIVKDKSDFLLHTTNISPYNNINLNAVSIEHGILDHSTILTGQAGIFHYYTGDNYGLPDNDKNLIEIAWERFPKGITRDSIHIETNPDIPALIEATEELRYPKKLYYGTVILDFIINTDGEIDDLSVLKEEPVGKGFLECAVRYIETCKIKPAEKNGQKVNTRITVNVEFCKDCPFKSRGSGDVVFRESDT